MYLSLTFIITFIIITSRLILNRIPVFYVLLHFPKEVFMKFISYDLGTGGVKASLHDEKLNTLARSFIEYKTYYPKPGFHEQKPKNWWQGVIKSTKILLEQSHTDPKEIACIALSGHSCIAVPIDSAQDLLIDSVPIWSDTRAQDEAEEFFCTVDRSSWYMTTGNGFPPSCYAIFKMMWYRRHMPGLYDRTDKFIGSKDYINMKLTGQIATDYSYASSSGVYDLTTRRYEPDLLKAAGVSGSLFPPITASHTIIGNITEDAAREIGLTTAAKVACGGVDNACMAMGAVGAVDGKAYTSLGSSNWIPVNSKAPVLDPVTRPYVFAHIQEDMYTSAYSIFAGGSSLKWVRDTICKDLSGEPDVYDKMSELAGKSPAGSNGILFNPSLAGGTSQDKSIHIRGAYIGLHLGTSRNDLIRAAMEGIALNLRMSLDHLGRHIRLADELLFCGGGSKSLFWMQMFADVFGMDIIKTNIDQNAASLGAAAICARAVGLWKDYTDVPKLHTIEHRCVPDKENHETYRNILKVFEHICTAAADLGDYMHKNLMPSIEKKGAYHDDQII